MQMRVSNNLRVAIMMYRRIALMSATYFAFVSTNAFVFHHNDRNVRSVMGVNHDRKKSVMGGYCDLRSSPLCMVVEIGPTDDDVEPALPGEMKISEIKSGELLYTNLEYLICVCF